MKDWSGNGRNLQLVSAPNGDNMKYLCLKNNNNYCSYAFAPPPPVTT